MMNLRSSFAFVNLGAIEDFYSGGTPNGENLREERKKSYQHVPLLCRRRGFEGVESCSEKCFAKPILFVHKLPKVPQFSIPTAIQQLLLKKEC